MAPEAPLTVLYRSPALIAVDKPAGIIVHGDGTGTATLTDRVRDEAGLTDTQMRNLQCLQRLDRETSGIVLFSLDKATQPAYDRLIAEHGIRKRYRALVSGNPGWEKRTFRGAIGRDRHDARRMRLSRTGKPAVTHARVAARLPYRRRACALLDIEIETGRKHQIRVHLSSAGLPIVGDALYGSPDPAGLMLHAARLSFSDPVTGAPVDITAPLPQRFPTP